MKKMPSVLLCPTVTPNANERQLKYTCIGVCVVFSTYLKIFFSLHVCGNIVNGVIVNFTNISSD